MTGEVDPEAKAFGIYVRGLRKGLELTQQQLADQCSLAADTIQRLENGSFSPTLTTLRKLASGFGRSVSRESSNSCVCSCERWMTNEAEAASS